MCRRCLTLLRLKPWAAVREAAVAPSRESVIRSVMSRSSRRSRRLHGRFVLGLGAHRAGESHGVAKPQISSLRRVRISGKHLHRECPARWPGHSWLSGVRVPSLRWGRVAIRIPLTLYERTTPTMPMTGAQIVSVAGASAARTLEGRSRLVPVGTESFVLYVKGLGRRRRWSAQDHQMPHADRRARTARCAARPP
jgi:hypothetical protein